MTFDVGANSGNTISVFVDVLDDLLVEGTESFTLSGAISTTIAAPGLHICRWWCYSVHR